MAMGREGDRQGDLIVTWEEMPRSPGHVFYDRLQEVLIAGGFDLFVETACQPYYAPKMGAPSLPPGRYFRMHMVGYFEGIASERGIAWRCSDSMSLRDFLRLENREEVPDHSWLSKTRGRLPREVHERVFGWVLKLVAEQGLVKGQADRCRRLDDGGQRRATHDRAPGGWPDLPRNADADGPGERHRYADGGRSRPHRSQPQGQEAVKPRVDEQDRSRGQDREAEGRSHALGLQARARRRSRHRNRRRGGTASRRSRRHNAHRRHAAGAR